MYRRVRRAHRAGEETHRRQATSCSGSSSTAPAAPQRFAQPAFGLEEARACSLEPAPLLTPKSISPLGEVTLAKLLVLPHSTPSRRARRAQGDASSIRPARRRRPKTCSTGSRLRTQPDAPSHPRPALRRGRHAQLCSAWRGRGGPSPRRAWSTATEDGSRRSADLRATGRRAAPGLGAPAGARPGPAGSTWRHAPA